MWKKRESPHFPATRLAESLARPRSAPQFDRDLQLSLASERHAHPPAPRAFSSLTTSTMASQVRPLLGPRRGIAVADSIRPNSSRPRACAARRASAAPRRAASISRRVRNAHARGSMTREARSDARSRLTRAPSRRPRPSSQVFALNAPVLAKNASARRDVAPRARSNPPPASSPSRAAPSLREKPPAEGHPPARRVRIGSRDAGRARTARDRASRDADADVFPSPIRSRSSSAPVPSTPQSSQGQLRWPEGGPRDERGARLRDHRAAGTDYGPGLEMAPTGQVDAVRPRPVPLELEEMELPSTRSRTSRRTRPRS